MGKKFKNINNDSPTPYSLSLSNRMGMGTNKQEMKIDANQLFNDPVYGLSIREYMVIQFTKALLYSLNADNINGQPTSQHIPVWCAKKALEQADELIKQLNSEQ